MSKIHHIKITPGSEAEEYFMELLDKIGVNPQLVICRLGAIFGTPYNEYVLSDGLYHKMRECLLEIKGPLASNG